MNKETQTLESLLVKQASNKWRGLRLLVFLITPLCVLGAGYFLFISKDDERLIDAYLCVASPIAILFLLALATVNARSEIRFVTRDYAPVRAKVLSARYWTTNFYIMALQYSHHGKEYTGKVVVDTSLAKSNATEASILVSNRNPKRFLLAPEVPDGPERKSNNHVAVN